MIFRVNLNKVVKAEMNLMKKSCVTLLGKVFPRPLFLPIVNITKHIMSSSHVPFLSCFYISSAGGACHDTTDRGLTRLESSDGALGVEQDNTRSALRVA